MFRLQYILISFILTVSLCYCNKDLLLFFLTFNALASNSKTRFYGFGIDYFIYTHPSELIATYLVIILYFASIISFYLLLWHLLDFSKSSLFISEFEKLSRMIKRMTFGLCFINVLLLIQIFPNCWGFFESFNSSSSTDTTLKFFLELKIKDYVSFLKSFLYTSNIGLILTFILHLFLKYQSFDDLLKWKKLTLFLSVFLITICGPSDALSQIFGIVLLCCFLELTVFFRILEFKSRKNFKVITSTRF